MLKRILTIVIMSMLVVSSAYALTGVEGCPDGDANAFRIDGDNLPEQNICIGKIELDDMGEFIGGVFVWNEAFRSELSGWGTTGYEMFTPIELPGCMNIDDSRMDFKQFPNGTVHTRVAVMLTETADCYQMPELWRVTGPNGEESDYFIANFNHEGLPEFDTIQGEEGILVSADRMGTLTWNEQGLTIPMTQVDTIEMYSVNYNNDRGVQNWELGGLVWDATDHYYRFPDGVIPALGTNTFTLQVDGEPFDLNYNVVSTEPMPVVPATTSNMVTQVVQSKSGKTIKGLSGQEVEVITPNIIVSELQGALVVQWAEPDLALFPDGFANHIELRMHVGRPYIGVDVSEGPSLWVAAPYQTGTIVVPADAYSFIKNEIKTRYPADTELYIQFQYRFKYFTDGTSGSTQNRGYGDGIRIPLN